MNDVQLFFYPGNTTTESAAYAIRKVSVDAYGTKDIVVPLSAEALSKIFPGNNTKCTVYAVSNVSSSKDLITDKASIETIKATAISATVADFQNEKWNIPMAGMGTVELSKPAMTVSGSIQLERSVAKITLDISVKKTITADDGTTTYEFSGKYDDVTAYIYNGARCGLIDGLASSATRNYTRISDGKAVYTLGYKAVDTSNSAETDNTSSSYTLEIPFYSFPNEWESESSDNETTLRLKVPWKTSGESSWTTYYYRVPINDISHRLDRNTHYRIKLNVGMLGSKVASTPQTLDDIEYKILDWSKDDIDLVQDLSTSRYLVVEENNFTLTNVSDTVIRYNSSAELKDVYLESVSYESTSILTNGEPTTVYLYKSDGSYVTNDETVRKNYTTAKDEIENVVVNSITNESDMSDDGKTYIGSGQINFSANVLNIPAEVYRPVTYTLVLKASDISSTIKVRLTQYPARYIEFGNAGNAFVNGYYANLNLDEGYTEDSLPEGSIYETSIWGSDTSGRISINLYCYHSLSFICTGYSGDSDNAYYSSNSTNLCANFTSINYGTNSPATTNMGGINTSYEYVRGTVNNSSSVNFESTIDVTVSAFSSGTNQYTVGNHTGNYIIGDPRVDGEYLADTHHNTKSYEYSDSHLYDYLICGKQSGSTYYRYVKSWGDLASQIKVGGRDEKYDDIIAPMFKIQSSLGAAASLTYYKVAEKRCATYQEAGYPAGRWRLPTMAELAFLIELQGKKVINTMISTNANGYWTSSGKSVNLSSGAANYKTGSTACFVRCVYDTWYWGNEPELPTHKYYPMPYFK
jgi:hypothetical protein